MIQPNRGPGETAQVLLLSTEQQVYAFELSSTERIGIGRHDSNDLQLGSRTVSNYHAEVLNEAEGLLLRDIDSTNGTYVNGERVDQRRLNSGDRVCIGNYLLTVNIKPLENHSEGFYRCRRDPENFKVGTRGHLISLRASTDLAQKTLETSEPRDLSLPDLLKILSTNARSVMLMIKRGSEESRVYVKKDRVVHAEYGRATGEKALYRLFGWQRATYELMGFPTTPAIPQTITLPIDTLIIMGMQQVSELGKLVTQLPPLEVPLQLKEDCSLPVSAHSSAEIEIYQSIIRYQTIARVLEETSMTDFRALLSINALLRKGVVEVSETTDAQLEDTFVLRAQPNTLG
jgi:pSer/pThr/pTyr-binding forkhead associated (FHA) protein